jgi:hypothetical protein
MIDKNFFKNLADAHYGTQLNVTKLAYGDVMFAMLELEQTILKNITVCENMQKDYMLEDDEAKAILMQGRIDTWITALDLFKETQAKILNK